MYIILVGEKMGEGMILSCFRGADESLIMEVLND